MLESIYRIYLITHKGEIIRTTLVIYLVLVMAATSVSANPVINESENPQFLFVMSAVSGSFDGETLTLTDVPAVIYFSDRPYRIAGHMSIQELVDIWGEGANSYEIDAPNASLSILGEDGNWNAVVEISNPILMNNTITFTANILLGTIPANFAVSTLFIDVLAGSFGLFGVIVS